MTQQTDLFGNRIAQGELFAASKAPPQVAPVTPDSVRAKLLAMIAQLRAAERMPWPDRKVRINQAIFPQMANWLPSDERQQVILQFDLELQRLLRSG